MADIVRSTSGTLVQAEIVASNTNNTITSSNSSTEQEQGASSSSSSSSSEAGGKTCYTPLPLTSSENLPVFTTTKELNTAITPKISHSYTVLNSIESLSNSALSSSVALAPQSPQAPSSSLASSSSSANFEILRLKEKLASAQSELSTVKAKYAALQSENARLKLQLSRNAFLSGPAAAANLSQMGGSSSSSSSSSPTQQQQQLPGSSSGGVSSSSSPLSTRDNGGCGSASTGVRSRSNTGAISPSIPDDLLLFLNTHNNSQNNNNYNNSNNSNNNNENSYHQHATDAADIINHSSNGRSVLSPPSSSVSSGSVIAAKLMAFSRSASVSQFASIATGSNSSSSNSSGGHSSTGTGVGWYRERTGSAPVVIVPMPKPSSVVGTIPSISSASSSLWSSSSTSPTSSSSSLSSSLIGNTSTTADTLQSPSSTPALPASSFHMHSATPSTETQSTLMKTSSSTASSSVTVEIEQQQQPKEEKMHPTTNNDEATVAAAITTTTGTSGITTSINNTSSSSPIATSSSSSPSTTGTFSFASAFSQMSLFSKSAATTTTAVSNNSDKPSVLVEKPSLLTSILGATEDTPAASAVIATTKAPASPPPPPPSSSAASASAIQVSTASPITSTTTTQASSQPILSGASSFWASLFTPSRPKFSVNNERLKRPHWQRTRSYSFIDVQHTSGGMKYHFHEKKEEGGKGEEIKQEAISSSSSSSSISSISSPSSHLIDNTFVHKFFPTLDQREAAIISPSFFRIVAVAPGEALPRGHCMLISGSAMVYKQPVFDARLVPTIVDREKDKALQVTGEQSMIDKQLQQHVTTAKEKEEGNSVKNTSSSPSSLSIPMAPGHRLHIGSVVPVRAARSTTATSTSTTKETEKSNDVSRSRSSSSSLSTNINNSSIPSASPSTSSWITLASIGSGSNSSSTPPVTSPATALTTQHHPSKPQFSVCAYSTSLSTLCIVLPQSRRAASWLTSARTIEPTVAHNAPAIMTKLEQAILASKTLPMYTASLQRYREMLHGLPVPNHELYFGKTNTVKKKKVMMRKKNGEDVLNTITTNIKDEDDDDDDAVATASDTDSLVTASALRQAIADLVRESGIFIDGEYYPLGTIQALQSICKLLYTRILHAYEATTTSIPSSSSVPPIPTTTSSCTASSSSSSTTTTRLLAKQTLCRLLISVSRTVHGGDVMKLVSTSLIQPAVCFLAAESGAPSEVIFHHSHRQGNERGETISSVSTTVDLQGRGREEGARLIELTSTNCFRIINPDASMSPVHNHNHNHNSSSNNNVIALLRCSLHEELSFSSSFLGKNETLITTTKDHISLSEDEETSSMFVVTSADADAIQQIDEEEKGVKRQQAIPNSGTTSTSKTGGGKQLYKPAISILDEELLLFSSETGGEEKGTLAVPIMSKVDERELSRLSENRKLQIDVVLG